MEWTPFKWRGLVSGLVQGVFSFGAAAAAAVEGVFLSIYGVSGVESFAWRYIFLTSIVPAVIALAARLSIDDTPVFQDLKS
ncbi:hypothetical protein HS1genome_1183 [Sulfodiicoccus acidiphilus]|uniref:Major facilitator superfamily (MFS) profile domain-containing protein n=1 Tax=Sulfodiicoccus acidiphilus TaxID=1670455 RepID=A0A348B3P2_9CREN|nr:hypothetical protein HS1genome_1183 [Sulfodiicoccus acidiphilus]GGT99861.1 hypothetical protein GCM10007116_16560 [Sulfodiicoccus acidiphilus]